MQLGLKLAQGIKITLCRRDAGQQQYQQPLPVQLYLARQLQAEIADEDRESGGKQQRSHHEQFVIEWTAGALVVDKTVGHAEQGDVAAQRGDQQRGRKQPPALGAKHTGGDDRSDKPYGSNHHRRGECVAR